MVNSIIELDESELMEAPTSAEMIEVDEEDIAPSTLEIDEDELNNSSRQLSMLDEGKEILASVWKDSLKPTLGDIGNEAKEKGPLGVFQQAGEMVLDAGRKSLAGAASLPSDATSIMFSGIGKAVELTAGEKYAKGYKQLAQETGKQVESISDTVLDTIGYKKKSEGVEAATTIMSLISGMSGGMAAGKSIKEIQALKKSDEVFEAIGTITKKGIIASAKDAAIGTAVVSGPDSTNSLSSTLIDEDLQDTPLDRRLILPLETLVGNAAVDAAVKYAVKPSASKLAEVYTKYKGRDAVPFDSKSSKFYDSVLGNFIKDNFSSPFDDAAKVGKPTKDLNVPAVKDNVAKKYIDKNYTEDSVTRGFNAKTLSTVGWRSSTNEGFAILEGLDRQVRKFYKFTRDGRSSDSYEDAFFNSSRMMRETKQGVGYGLIHESETPLGLPFYDRDGLMQWRKGKPLNKIYKDAQAQGATEADIDLYDTALDSLDNYINLRKTAADNMDSLMGFIENSDDLADSWYIKSKADIIRLTDSIFAEPNVKVKGSGGISYTKDDAFLKIVKGEIKRVVSSAPKAYQAKLTTKFNKVLEPAMKLHVMPEQDAVDAVAKYSATKWGQGFKYDMSTLNNHTLNLMTDAGYFSQTQADALRAAHPSYLPNFKVVDIMGFDDSAVRPSSKKATSLKGREVSSIDQKSSIAARHEYLRSVGAMTTESRIRNGIAQWMQSWGSEDYQLFTFANKDKVEKALAHIKKGKGDLNFSAAQLADDKFMAGNTIKSFDKTMTINVNGGTLELPIRNKQIYDVVMAGHNLPVKTGGLAMGFSIAGRAMKLSRNAIVYTPSFVAKTAIQETTDILFNSNTSILNRLKTMGNTPKNLFAKDIDPVKWQKFQMRNGFYGNASLMENSADDKTLAKMLLSKAEGTQSYGGKFLEKADELLKRVDFAPRIAYYDKLIDLGYKESEAMWLAKDLGVRFTQRGTVDNLASKAVFSVPFMRTYVNSVDRLARRLRYNTKAAVPGIVTGGTAYWIINKATGKQDSELNKDQQRKNLVINIGGDQEAIVPLPYNLPANPYSVSMDYAVNLFDKEVGGAIIGYLDELYPEFGKAVRESDPTGAEVAEEWAMWAYNIFMPTNKVPFASTALAVTTGVTTSGIPLMSDELAGGEARKQYTTNTSDSVIALSQKLYEKTGVQLSPIKMEAVMNSMLPGVFDLATKITDYSLAAYGIIPEQPRIEESSTPFVQRFVKRPNNQSTKQIFYGLHGAAMEAQRLVEKAKDDAMDDPSTVIEFNKLQEENEEFLQIGKITYKAQQEVKKIEDYKNAFDKGVDPDWESDADREIRGSIPRLERMNRLTKMSGDIMRNAIKEIEQLQNGKELVDIYSRPLPWVLESVFGALGLRKTEKEATYHEDYDDLYRVEPIVNDKSSNNTNGLDKDVGEEVRYENISLTTNLPTSLHEQIVDVAEEMGINPKIPLVIAQMESRVGGLTDNPTSNATGIFQIVPKTWNGMVSQGFGEEYGITRADINKPLANTRMALILMKNDVSKAEMSLERRLNLPEIYAIHHFGIGNGLEFIRAKDRNPNISMSDILPDNAIRSNPQFKNEQAGRVMNVREVNSLFVKKINTAVNELTGKGEPVGNNL